MAKTRTVFRVEYAVLTTSGRKTWFNASQTTSYQEKRWPVFFATKREAADVSDMFADECTAEIVGTRVVSEKWPAHRMLHAGCNDFLDRLAMLADADAVKKSFSNLPAELGAEFSERAVGLMERAIPILRALTKDDDD